MKAVILAAGKGERLGASLPKPLIKLLGRALIDHVIDNLKRTGIKDIVVVYRDPKVKAYLEGRVKLVLNDKVELGGGYSLLKGAEVVEGEPFILVMADHIFDFKILKKLLESKPDITTLCVDRKFEGHNVEEATRVLLGQEEYILDLGKELKNYNALDTGVFYCTQEVLEAARSFKGKFSVTDVMRTLAREKKLKALDVSGLFWRDIDTKQELRRVEKELLYRLIKPSDGIVSRHFNRKISLRISRFLVNTPVTPNVISFFSFLLGIISAFLFAHGHNFTAGITAQISSIIDGCDGEIARLKKMSSSFGAFFDSLLDRYADAAIITGIIASDPSKLWLPGIFALLGSYSISYTSSKAENTGFQYKGLTQLMKRDMRLVIIFLGGIAGLLWETLMLLAFFTNLVVFLRLLYSFEILDRE